MGRSFLRRRFGTRGASPGTAAAPHRSVSFVGATAPAGWWLASPARAVTRSQLTGSLTRVPKRTSHRASSFSGVAHWGHVGAPPQQQTQVQGNRRGSGGAGAATAAVSAAAATAACGSRTRGCRGRGPALGRSAGACRAGLLRAALSRVCVAGPPPCGTQCTCRLHPLATTEAARGLRARRRGRLAVSESALVMWRWHG